MQQQPHNKFIAVLASGAGSNTQKIIDYFKNTAEIKVALILSNKADAGVIKIAEKEKVPFLIIEKNKFYLDGYLTEIKHYNIDLIVLAGFLWKIPNVLIQSYQNKIINIHPALLPKFGGKNMYGNFVHAAVIKSGEKQSGITIHFVDEIYDHGKIIFQKKCEVENHDTVDSLATKIHLLEHEYYPSIIEKIVKENL